MMKLLSLKAAVAGVALALLVGAGCSKASEAPVAAQQNEPLDRAIEAIQNNPNMPPQAKQQAIDHIKEQKSRVVTQPQTQ